MMKSGNKTLTSLHNKATKYPSIFNQTPRGGADEEPQTEEEEMLIDYQR